MIETRLREDLCRFAASRFQRSYTVGSSGNIRLILCGHPLQKLTHIVTTFNPPR